MHSPDGGRQSISEQILREPAIQSGLQTLLSAYQYSVDTASDLWDFAVSIGHLRDENLTDSDLRWLVRKGYVEHAREVTPQGDNGREFRPTGDLTFSRRTCFILTEEGVTAARSISRATSVPDDATIRIDDDNGQTPKDSRPHWDPETRTLSLNGQVVKRFKWPAANQETVLNAFQEEDWPNRIDDPLPPKLEQDSKRRLADTIKCLNRKQDNLLIRFHGDGTGEGVFREIVDQDAGSNGAE